MISITLKRINYIDRYIGVSTDIKPVGVDPGSTFYESDTTNTYIYDGSNWYLKT